MKQLIATSNCIANNCKYQPKSFLFVIVFYTSLWLKIFCLSEGIYFHLQLFELFSDKISEQGAIRLWFEYELINIITDLDPVYCNENMPVQY